ncbi:uncharacterized protein LOC34619371 [Cyclospora cayetanensis]|uniref:Uncharacterized protein LOC34619371 n=1 Tax=Cyclospora cayetanensis TaxID=88456 RepID=A0A6P6S1S7_9EIME|nr:uncharacterized protein LOC34619371 [Cyclospora cayetanensis]
MGNLHALIPSKFKYRFPRERIPRHQSYEVLAVEDNPNAPPLAPLPPKKPHKKKSIFGIAKRVQQRRLETQQASDSIMGASRDYSKLETWGARGWVKDFNCFLCTSTDYVSEEQTQLEVENAQLDEALAEYQETTRAQALQLTEAKKEFEQRLLSNQREREEAARDIVAVKDALQRIQEERDHLMEQQKESDSRQCHEQF